MSGIRLGTNSNASPSFGEIIGVAESMRERPQQMSIRNARVGSESDNEAGETNRESFADIKSNFTVNDSKVVRALKTLYKNTLRPIEKTHIFNKFNHPEILESEFHSKPTVLILGQYSTGKTSFIRHMLGCDYPGIHIGPEVSSFK